MEIPIIFTSGLPRSGSTLLQNLLAQHPRHHCTATNDLLDMVMKVRDSWMAMSGFMAQGLANIEPRVKSYLRCGIRGFYESEFDAGKTVFDKSRGWIANIELIEKILGRQVRVIVTVRDVRDVVASFEKIYRRSSLTDHPVQGAEVWRRLTIQGRAERLCSIDHTIGYSISCIQDAIDRGLSNRLVVVPYKELTHSPITCIRRVCKECGVEPFDCNPHHVEQVTREDDTVYGMALHNVRPSVEPDRESQWVGTIPESLADILDKTYPNIQRLARWNINTSLKTNVMTPSLKR